MSESKARAARRTRRPPNGAQPAIVEAQPSGESQEGVGMTHPAVLVMRVPGEQPGQERIEFMEVNGIDPLAVPTLLRIAANLKDQALGLGERK